MRTHIELLIQGQTTEVPVDFEYDYSPGFACFADVLEITSCDIAGTSQSLMDILTPRQMETLADHAREEMDGEYERRMAGLEDYWDGVAQDRALEARHG